MRNIIKVGATLSLVTALAACGSGSDDDKSSSGPTKVDIVVLPVAAVAPVFLANEKGWFKDEGITVTPKVAQNGAATTAELLSGGAQFGFMSPVPVLVAQTQNVPIQIVCGSTAEKAEHDQQSVAVLVAADSAITSAADLEGKTVAVNALKAADQLTTVEAITEDGGDAGKVEFIALPYPDMAAALSSGRVDAIVPNEPFYSAAQAQGMRVVAYPNDAYNSATTAVWVASKDFIAKNPDTVEKFCDVVDEASVYGNEHTDEMREVITTYTKIPAEAAAKMRLFTWTADVDAATIEALAEMLDEHGFVDKAPDASQILPQD